MDKKRRMLNEDSQMIYNKWVSGVAKREAPPEVITVGDIQNRFRNNLEYRAPSVLPFPLNGILDFLGNLFIKSAEMRHSLGSAVTYPVIKEQKSKIDAIKKLNEKLHRIQDIIYSCTEELNVLVENRKK
jgi:hypothetical protein